MSLRFAKLENQVPQIFLPTRPGFFRDPDENTKYYLRETYGRLLVVGSLSLRNLEPDHTRPEYHHGNRSFFLIMYTFLKNIFWFIYTLKTYLFIHIVIHICIHHFFHVYIYICFTDTQLFFIYDKKPMSICQSSFQPCSKLSH